MNTITKIDIITRPNKLEDLKEALNGIGVQGMAKYIFVTGGVVSSLGKGITAASLGRLLKSRGIKVTIQKFDPYINIDPGTMSPYQHAAC